MKSPEKIKMVIDHRETNRLLLESLANHPLMQVRKGTLETGDFKINNTLLVERKTCSDFVLSIIQGRLFRQAYRLTKHVHDRTIETAVMIIEGAESDFQRVNVSREAIFGAIVSLQIRFHLPVFRTLDPVETVRMIDTIHHQMTMGLGDPGRSFPARHRTFNRKTKLRQQIFILQGLPGIGAARARDLLDHFGSVGNVFTASREQLQQVPGIGKDTARGIKEILGS